MSEVRSVGVKDGAELTDRVRTARTKKEGKARPPTPPPASEVPTKSRKNRRGGRRIEILVRDDRFVREVFERQRRADSVALAGQASECDEALFLFVDELRMGNSFESMWPQVSRYEPERKKRVDPRRSYSSTLLGTLSLLSRYTGACSGPQVAEVLLRDERWMQLLGFGLQEIREGSNARSLSLKGKTRDESNRFVSLPTNDDTPSEPDGEVKGTQSTTEESNRGALSSQSVADFEGQLNAGELESWFNRLIASCASNGLFPRVIDGVIDATDLETPERF